jgi:hypothetical protein
MAEDKRAPCLSHFCHSNVLLVLLQCPKIAWIIMLLNDLDVFRCSVVVFMVFLVAEECVKVVIRCRPMSRQETIDNREKIVDMEPFLQHRNYDTV